MSDQATTHPTPNFSVGSLVRARDREWVVLPDSTPELLILKPLAGRDDEITGILTAVESVTSATFQAPEPRQLGDFQSCKLLRDALRLGFRNSAGPFRSFGRLAVDPRPYQLVPLMMALKLDPVRLLIADDVGIGKTIEACLIARELLDRGEISRLCVLCPPHLAEQWQAELRSKFHIEAELVLSNTVSRLERNCLQNQSIFEVYPYTVASIDYIKSDRRKDEFLRTAPELIIVDEAHTASFDDSLRSSRHHRHELVKRLSQDPTRHLILVTATPHSGKEKAFRSLLALLKPEFDEILPDDLSGPKNEHFRRNIAQHFVQRRRADIEEYLDEKTRFPIHITAEHHYQLSQPYHKLFDKALDYARELVLDKGGSHHRQRVHWWSALALLRALASSPAAAAATMRNRSGISKTTTVAEADELGRCSVLDIDDRESIYASDILPGSDTTAEGDDEARSHRRLLAMAREADALKGDQDRKMLGIIPKLQELLKAGFSPILFCRFIETAEYLAQQLRERIPKTEIASVTGRTPPEGREKIVAELAKNDQRILVCTDCLSEGINLQDHFDAVIHYDLSWNPTIHEQREGRVNRFGQGSPNVQLLTYYGIDNLIDSTIVRVLIEKHNQIKKDLHIAVPVPSNTEALIESIFRDLIEREQAGKSEQLYIEGFDQLLEIHNQWEKAKDKEKLSRSMFAQIGLSRRTDEIKKELDSIRASIGSQLVIQDFVLQALTRYQATIEKKKSHYQIGLSAVPTLVRESLGLQSDSSLQVSFDASPSKGQIHLSRTHPIVESLADLVINTALDSQSIKPIASRAGVIRTQAVTQRTTLLLIRHRIHLNQPYADRVHRSLAEDSQILAFTGAPDQPQWLSEAQAQALLDAQPTANVIPEQAQNLIQLVLDDYDAHLKPSVNASAHQRARQLEESHLRVRDAILKKGQKPTIKPELPPDLLGIYILLPAPVTTSDGG